jgi:hypothetical protein
MEVITPTFPDSGQLGAPQHSGVRSMRKLTALTVALSLSAAGQAFADSVVNTNISSAVAQNSLARAQAGMKVSSDRLSTGLRINSAADDAKGLAAASRIESAPHGAAVNRIESHHR